MVWSMLRSDSVQQAARLDGACLDLLPLPEDGLRPAEVDVGGGAVTRPTMRFVPMKTADAQAALLDHKVRDFLIRQQTRTVNTIRAHLAEFGIVVPKGIHNVDRLLEAAGRAPEAPRPALDLLADQLRGLRNRIETVTKRIEATRKTETLARRLATIPGLGPIASSAFAVTTPEVAAFRSARDYSAWLGLTPKPHSSGGKERLGRISKAGNTYLRRLLYLGAMAQIAARRRGRPGDDWLWDMLQRKPLKVVAIALANRMARVVWALIRTGESYRATRPNNICRKGPAPRRWARRA